MLPRDSPVARKMAGRSALWLRVWDITVAAALRSYRLAGFVLSTQALYPMLSVAASEERRRPPPPFCRACVALRASIRDAEPKAR